MLTTNFCFFLHPIFPREIIGTSDLSMYLGLDPKLTVVGWSMFCVCVKVTRSPTRPFTLEIQDSLTINKGRH